MTDTQTRSARFKAWRESEIGALFERYDAATGHAWVTDCTSNSPRKMEDMWEKHRAAKLAFLDVVCEMASLENPYQ